MERELFVLWFGATKHERCIKGLRAYVYIDHKNNIFSAFMLDNRMVTKKLSTWVLELQ